MNINNLYNKVKEFEAAQSDEFKSKLECKKGCSQCCYVDLSVFEIEAQNIRQWYESISDDERTEIHNKLKLSQQDRDDFAGIKKSPCHFLRNDECVIYPVRPLICRTQGNAFAIQVEEEQYLDICPLNEKAAEDIRSNDIINLNCRLFL